MPKLIKKQDIDIDKMGLNPFITPDFKIVLRKWDDTKSFKKTSVDGLGNPTYAVNEIEAEKDTYAKLFNQPAKRLLVTSLSSGAQRLLLYISYELAAAQDWIWINRKAYMDESGVSSINTFKKECKELCAVNIINENSIYKGVYWINPAYVFFGSRPNKWPDNVVYIKSPKKK